MADPAAWNANLWDQYKLHVDLYKHHMELMMKFNLFYYAITGGILSFYFSHRDLAYLRYALLFPVLMSLTFAGFFWYASGLVEYTQRDVDAIVAALRLQVSPELRVLKHSLRLFAALLAVVGLSLVTVFVVSFCQGR